MSDRMLEVDRLTRRYGDLVALQDLSFSVSPGELFGFVGSNGAGKTTTMRIVMGVLAADAGEVRWRGAPLTLETRRQFGYMPEERGLYPKMRVLEQLIYLAELHGLRAPSAQQAATGWLARLGLKERANDEVQKLSRGNQQRVQLAAALLYEPVLLVLDEPFAGLDPVAVDVMSSVLRDRARAGISVIFSSHQLDIVERLCDRVGIIKSGRMVVSGSIEELRQSGPRRYWVDTPAASDGWLQRVPAAKVARKDGSRTLIELDQDADDQAVLQAALATGPVREFRRDVPPLSELFRHVVAEDGPPVTS
ncbi:MAG TPA: ATP-binding cassette domain-containing protein [Candidatus Limnocylindrales bacterium]|nr:ATP-binding cassette domain-containing protein [Candidatus Limnocylindrales bacterium]